MKTIRKNRFFLSIILFFIIGASLYSCKCAKCLVTPPPLNAYATQLVLRNHAIDSGYAAGWIARYIANKDSICNNAVGGFDSVLVFSEAFNKNSIQKLLCLDGCIGLRIQYGMDSLFKVHQIITGVNQYGDNLYYIFKPGDPLPLGGSGGPNERVATETGMPTPP